MMKKLLFCFLAAALVLTSCSKDDSLPLPEVSKVEIIGATEGQMKITTGQTVGFSVECENVAIDRYEWIVNEKSKAKALGSTSRLRSAARTIFRSIFTTPTAESRPNRSESCR